MEGLKTYCRGFKSRASKNFINRLRISKRGVNGNQKQHLKNLKNLSPSHDWRKRRETDIFKTKPSPNNEILGAKESLRNQIYNSPRTSQARPLPLEQPRMNTWQHNIFEQPCIRAHGKTSRTAQQQSISLHWLHKHTELQKTLNIKFENQQLLRLPIQSNTEANKHLFEYAGSAARPSDCPTAPARLAQQIGNFGPQNGGQKLKHQTRPLALASLAPRLHGAVELLLTGGQHKPCASFNQQACKNTTSVAKGKRKTPQKLRQNAQKYLKTCPHFGGPKIDPFRGPPQGSYSF